MKELIRKLKQFNNTFKIKFNSSPGLIPENTYKLRYKLLAEENDEYLEACANNDLIEIADAIGDAYYILTGTALAHGLGDNIEEIFSKIHTSNMSKVCKTESEAEETIKAYKTGAHPDKPGEIIETYSVKDINGYVIRRMLDDKVMKSINYKPVKITLDD